MKRSSLEAAEELQRLDGPLAVLRKQRPLLSPIVRHASGMRHHLAQRHRPVLLRDLRRVRLKATVQRQLVFLEQQADAGGG
ncbi:MAG TPA: hypothetical protein VFO21_25675 [Vicinamibacterales bacterium]|nr:hypothetical protein [Vicinamibacterales bacterium]